MTDYIFILAEKDKLITIFEVETPPKISFMLKDEEFIKLQFQLI